MHALLPIIARRLHMRHPRLPLAPILFELMHARRYLREDLRGLHHGALVDVVNNSAVDAVEHVHHAEGEEAVEQELHVVGEGGGEGGVCVDEG